MVKDITNLILYSNKADSSLLNKTLFLDKRFELIGTFRTEVSVINPIIYIEVSDDMYITGRNVITKLDDKVIDNSYINIITLEDRTTLATKCNYIYIEEFNRYYYITDIVCVRNDLYELHCKVDVLMSFKDDILKLKALVLRNQFQFNENIKDDLIPYKYGKWVEEKVIEKSGAANFEFNPNLKVISNNFAVTVINDLGGTSFDLVNSPTTHLPTVGGWVTGNTAMSITYSTYPAQITNLAKNVLADNNLASYIVSIMCYPFELPSKSTSEYLTLGTKELNSVGNEVNVYKLNKQCSEYLILADFELNSKNFDIMSTDSFLNYSPYRTYELYLPYLGWITLDPELVLYNRIMVIYTVDYKSGASQVQVIADAGLYTNVIYSSAVQLGIKVPINSTNATEVENNRLANNIGLGLGLTASTLAAVGGIATVNPIVIGGAALSGANAVSSFINSQNTNYNRASGSIASPSNAVYSPQKVRLRITRPIATETLDNLAKYYGRPLNEEVVLSTLTGKTIVGDIRLNNVDGATKTELDEIESLLKNGVVL